MECSRSDKKWERAETLLQRALQVASESVHPDHPWIGLTWNNLGYVYLGRKHLDAAEKAFRRALQIWQKAFGGESLRAAVAGANLAGVLTDLRKYDEAHALLVRSLAVLEKSPDSAAPVFANTLEQSARLLRLRSDEQAQTLESRASAIRSVMKYTVRAGNLER